MNVIKQFKFWAVLIVAITLAISGCRKSEPSADIPTNPKAAASQIEQAFQNSSDMQARTQSEALAQAMRQYEYDRAYQALTALQATKAENFGQVIAIENTYRCFQAQLLAGVESGNPEAIRIWQQLKRSRRD